MFIFFPFGGKYDKNADNSNNNTAISVARFYFYKKKIMA